MSTRCGVVQGTRLCNRETVTFEKEIRRGVRREVQLCPRCDGSYMRMIEEQRAGRDAYLDIPPDAPLPVVEKVVRDPADRKTCGHSGHEYPATKAGSRIECPDCGLIRKVSDIYKRGVFIFPYHRPVGKSEDEQQ